MANVFSDVATLQVAALLNGADRPNATLYGGRLVTIQVKKTSYTAATADPLYLAILPKGALLVPALCSLRYGDPGDACTGKIGQFTVADTPAAIDDDAYGSGLALGGSAGTLSLSSASTIGADTGTPERLTVDSWLVVTWTTVTNGASHDQYWTIVYAV